MVYQRPTSGYRSCWPPHFTRFYRVFTEFFFHPRPRGGTISDRPDALIERRRVVSLLATYFARFFYWCSNIFLRRWNADGLSVVGENDGQIH